MAIQSFVVFTKPGRKAEACAALRTLPGAEVSPAEDRDVVILVTETDGTSGSESLERALESAPGVDGFSLVAGYSEEAIQSMAHEDLEEGE